MNRLRGNTFLLLLLRAGNQLLCTSQEYGNSKDGVTRPNMLADLLRFSKPDYEPLKIKTLASYFSKYLKGIELNSSYLPFNTASFKHGLNSRIADSYVIVLRQMDTFYHKYLDQNNYTARMLVAGIIDTILQDDSFDGDFDIGGRKVSKNELHHVETITLQPFLVSVWNNILLNHPDTSEGADTYKRWIDAVGYNSPKSITTDIGAERANRIEVITVMKQDEAEENIVEEAHCEEIIVEEVHDENPPKVEVYEAPFTDPITQKQVVAQFHVEAKDNGVAIGQVFVGLVIGKRGNKDE